MTDCTPLWYPDPTGHTAAARVDHERETLRSKNPALTRYQFGKLIARLEWLLRERSE